MPELTQLDKGKSTIRNLPPKGAAGLDRHSVRCLRREPRPPARIKARVLRVRRLTKRGPSGIDPPSAPYCHIMPITPEQPGLGPDPISGPSANHPPDRKWAMLTFLHLSEVYSSRRQHSPGKARSSYQLPVAGCQLPAAGSRQRHCVDAAYCVELVHGSSTRTRKLIWNGRRFVTIPSSVTGSKSILPEPCGRHLTK